MSRVIISTKAEFIKFGKTFTSEDLKMDAKKNFVTYEEFGAVGDGKNDDMPAIVACHDFANANGLDVRAKDGAEYYIGGKAISAKIMTNTNFGTAKFTIDDRVVEDIHKYCFEVVSANEPFTPEIKEIKAGQKKIDFPHEGTVYVRVEGDPEHRVFVRKGLNMNSGSVPAEAFIVDGDGNILTDINWDYPIISSAMAKNVDDEPITVEGGIFTTIANQWICEYASHARGFTITRSNVVIKDMQHFVTGELPDHGAPYGGFISIGKSYNVTLRDTLLTPRFAYMMESKVPGQKVWMGTYDLGMTHAIGSKLINLKQSRPLDAGEFWGIMGTNYCKDMLIEDCEISRFDAHCGITNCTIRRSKFGHAGLNLIGFGKFLIEDSSINAPRFINFRSDYGSFFIGDVTVKNCVWKPRFNRDLCIFSAYNEGDHDFGYECKLAENLTVDGLVVDDLHIDADKTLNVITPYDNNFEKGKPYAYKLPEKFVVKGVKSLSGKEVGFTTAPEQYEDCEIEFD